VSLTETAFAALLEELGGLQRRLVEQLGLL
jgi:hypothetical protein